MSQSLPSVAHCINPDCPRPYPQLWGNKFCNSCGASLLLHSRYIPLELLGTGGFAAIYTVWDDSAQTERVLKLLLETSPKALELFEQEAAVLASLHHPGVPKVEPSGFFQLSLNHPHVRQMSCLVMEKIHGQTLQSVLNQHPQGCPEALVRNWMNQAVEILLELHRRQIIHRDLKPSNLMLREGTGQLVAIDFGGAKQIGTMAGGLKSGTAEMSSTRLISPGYSPPEQIAGGAVGPAADFYALGRTMIQLLTGQYPSNLEDPQTGELRWRHCAPVSGDLADLLDEMVQVDYRQRPATSAEIQARLAGISSMKTALSKAPASFSGLITKVAKATLKFSWVALSAVSQAIIQAVFFSIWVATQVVTACLDTTWEMLLGGLGAGVFAAAGFWLAYSALGIRFARLLSEQLAFPIEPEILLFAAAGWGTAWGLTEAGGFGQRKRRLVAGLLGVFGYCLGWVVWQAPLTYGLVWFIAIAVGSLTLGLGLPSHQLVHACFAAAGTAAVFVGLSHGLLISQISWHDWSTSLPFFSLQAVTLAFWLGVSYYVVVPFLRWLGWR